MLKQRIITALVGLPFLIYLLLFGNDYSLIAMYAVFLVLSVYELAAMLLPRLEHFSLPASVANTSPSVVRVRTFDIAVSVGLGLLIFLSCAILDRTYALGIIISTLMFSILIAALLAKDNDTALGHALGYVMCIVYGASPWLIIWDLGTRAEHSGYVILVLAIVWSGDTGGYFGGRFFGKRLLAPRMSPKKTWEGAIAGILASVGGGLIANIALGRHLGTDAVIVIIAVFAGIAGQLGDLVESTFKRFARIKDSGVIFPGHGGFLDRCDGILFAAPVVWVILQFCAPAV